MEIESKVFLQVYLFFILSIATILLFKEEHT